MVSKSLGCYVPTRRALALAGSALMFMPQVANAQTAAPAAPSDAAATPATGDIVVTALRRDTALEKTPLSLTAVRGDTLKTATITDSTQLSRIAPGLTFAATPDGGNRIVLRSIQAAGEPTVGLYYGETPLTSPLGNNNDAGESAPTVQLFDVDHVEVLRGPQGTLFGSSSMAGTVRILFNNPNLEKYEGEIAGRSITVDHGDTGYEGQGVVNVPLVTDILAVRAVGFYTQNPGWVDDPALGRKDLNEVTNRGGRVMARFKPMDNLTIDGMAVIQDSSGNNPDWAYNGYRDGVTPAYVTELKSLQKQADKMRIYTGTFKWDLGGVAITGNAGWIRRYRQYDFDVSQLLNRFYPGNPISDHVLQHMTAATQELRAASTSSGPFQWTVGGFHSVRSEHSSSQLDNADPVTGELLLPASAALGTQIYDRRITSNLKQLAAYADVSYKLFDKLTFEAGGRYYDFKDTVGGAIPLAATRIGITQTPFSQDKSSNHGWLYKFNISYQMTPDLLVYAMTSTGVRPGGANQALNLPAALVPYKPDSVTNYEAGIKANFFDHKLTVNVDGFHLDWKDIQSIAEAGIFDIVANAGTVGVNGVEGDLTYTPFRGLTLTGSGSYTVGKLKGDQVVPGGITVTGAGLKGDYVPRSPKITAQASAQYGWSLTDRFQGLFRLDFAYQSAQWMFYQRTNAATQRLPGFATLGARIGVGDKSQGWDVSLYATNLFDKVGLLRLEDTGLDGGDSAVRATGIAPRTIGVAFDKKF